MEQEDKFTPEERAAQKLYWKFTICFQKGYFLSRGLTVKLN
jgi:hypothetical protein